jgi:hypothetical protein
MLTSKPAYMPARLHAFRTDTPRFARAPYPSFRPIAAGPFGGTYAEMLSANPRRLGTGRAVDEGLDFRQHAQDAVERRGVREDHFLHFPVVLL